jgi:8-oxo-dGTP diphosphatase
MKSMASSQEKKKRVPSGEGEATVVAVGVILRENRVLVSRRREGTHLAGNWEFPGGTVRPGETAVDALHREIEEELGIRFVKATLIHRKHHSYPDRLVELHYFLCTGIEGEPNGAEGQETRWVSASDLEHLKTPAANAEVIGMLQDQLG